jgi:6-phosphogluconolactonase
MNEHPAKRFVVRNRQVLVFENSQRVWTYAYGIWRKIEEKAIAKRGCFSVALSGGATPNPFYRGLAGLEITQWDKLHIFLVDERFVAYDRPESNYGIILKNLLDRVPVPAENIHPIPIEETAALSAQRYEEDMKRLFKLGDSEFPRFDFVILGIGEDGHTASLFAGSSAINEKAHIAVAVKHEEVKTERITFTLPVINNARNVIFMATGPRKAEGVRLALERERDNVAASLVHPERGEILFLLDEPAGSMLSDLPDIQNPKG